MEVAKKEADLSQYNWRSYQSSLSTWCNQYAKDVSREIYGEDPTTGEYPVPSGKTANELYDYFNTNINDRTNKVYVELVSNTESEKLWKFIDLGYSIYFSKEDDDGHGHIETGFPDGVQNIVGNREKYTEKYSLLSKIDALEKTNLSIGAGASVGFKSYNKYKFLKTSSKFI